MAAAKKTSKSAENAPDPVWGMGLFIIGLLVMAFGGATTRHWVFNVGEGVLLLGVVVFLVAVGITSHRQEHVVKRLRRAFRGDTPEGD